MRRPSELAVWRFTQLVVFATLIVESGAAQPAIPIVALVLSAYLATTSEVRS